MDSKVTVLVIGAGRFAQNYLNILAGLNSLNARGMPRIERLVLSRTDRAAARAMASEISSQQDCPFRDVIGVAISGVAQLRDVLHRYAPVLSCITARDPESGDDIHALYAGPALDSGSVLCEKPFSLAKGDGASLKRIEALTAHPHAGRFGLELPMAILGRAMAADRQWAKMLRDARTIEFLWEKQSGSNDLISDLALHPWSLLPPQWRVEVDGVRIKARQVDLELTLTPPDTSAPIKQCTIRLAAGGLFRGMRLDHHAYQICFDRGQVQLWEYAAPWQEVIAGRTEKGRARMVMAVDNPLRQHIEAALTGQPLVGIKWTCQSQQFLETIGRFLARRA